MAAARQATEAAAAAAAVDAALGVAREREDRAAEEHQRRWDKQHAVMVTLEARLDDAQQGISVSGCFVCSS